VIGRGRAGNGLSKDALFEENLRWAMQVPSEGTSGCTDDGVFLRNEQGLSQRVLLKGLLLLVVLPKERV